MVLSHRPRWFNVNALPYQAVSLANILTCPTQRYSQ
jgi:hypothetical protein